MTSSPQISVIILAYNHTASIARAIESVVAVCKDLDAEILIGEDASTDDTRRICEDAARKYPHLIRLMPASPNKGMVNNYFDCVMAARGRYITDCAGDDFWHPYHPLAVMAKALDENPGVAVAFADTVKEWPDGSHSLVRTIASDYVGGRRMRFPGREIMQYLLNSTSALPYVLSSALYRRDAIIEALNEKEDMVRNVDFGIEDVPVIAALAARGDAIYIPRRASIYIQMPESVSHSASPLKEAVFYSRVLECIRQLALYYNVALDTLSDGFYAKVRYIAACLRSASDPAEARRMKKLISLWPQQIPLTARINLFAARHSRVSALIRAIKKVIR